MSDNKYIGTRIAMDRVAGATLLLATVGLSAVKAPPSWYFLANGVLGAVYAFFSFSGMFAPRFVAKIARDNSSGGRRAVRWLFALVERVVPQRIAGEELGDAMEVVSTSTSAWSLYLFAARTVTWVLLHAAYLVVRRLVMLIFRGVRKRSG